MIDNPMLFPNENKKLTDIVHALNKLAETFNIAHTSDMVYSLIVKEMELIAKELNLNGALEELDKLKNVSTLLAFEKARKDIFSNPETAIHIWNPVTDTIELSSMLENILKVPSED